ncbi:UDP-N-acetylmuramoyl-L-alanine--D-glutamate ligase [Flammeovirga yaeyamensis]|uniref:UDP-N-acetylmuramoylalanine--D-glutamate ligase n=1 Tax=Flammeovirga yaeyamensis TaxID=367791 RepID=A0AAX1NAS6_9BACT|nr:UDP-N-acetylmuramoyl-L-alanine--D-glutamate ligase [Flammeovirga yaeyamensis]MBB3697983.1 UDP-N-acetylmuramoylalanine--D-glutamate ligase [Flammeovirga yaeyamensis]NMF35665.1 UDP-N-acetylmuramoyl-L-alanine--D-glutamate ligase [Flammeovirga yaeyamensis]QWG03380.1 UDP-N-acetylmuramoyl-L-alanine--D-glutamate ligase [Flammeovirga yaeyamensis]
MKDKLLVLGAGESGIGAALLALSKGFDVFVSDFGKISEEQKKTLKTHSIPFEEGSHDKAPRNPKIVVKSPGIPDTVPIIKELKANNAKIYSEIEFAYQYTDAKIIAITGTNGKTTTTKLIYHLLNESGFNVGLAGNIGISFAKEVLENDYDWYVLEISSFQLDDIETFAPDISLILNITPDHLDRYNFDINQYADSKFRIIENMSMKGSFIYSEDDQNIKKHLSKRNIKPWAIGFDHTFFEQGKLTIPFKGDSYSFNHLPLKGPHNEWNMSAAILAALSAGVSPEDIQAALPSFVGEPHRLQFVKEVNHIKYINDSKATNVEAAFFALQSFDTPIVWIAGGTDKGNDYSMLHDAVERRVKSIICLGTDNSKLLAAFGDQKVMIETQSMEEAISLATNAADTGEVVLLSPACASFDLFKNYMDRGDHFIEAVQKL